MRSATLTIPGRPVAKQRPRIGAHGAYTPARTREYENTVAWLARAHRIRMEDRLLRVSIVLWGVKPFRGDLDNYAKAILDGLEKGQAFDNDRQIKELSVQMVVGKEDKATVELEVLGAN